MIQSIMYQTEPYFQKIAEAITKHLTVKIDNDPNQATRVSWGQLKNILQWPSKSHDLHRIVHAFLLLNTKLKAERPSNKQQLKAGAVKD